MGLDARRPEPALALALALALLLAPARLSPLPPLPLEGRESSCSPACLPRTAPALPLLALPGRIALASGDRAQAARRGQRVLSLGLICCVSPTRQPGRPPLASVSPRYGERPPRFLSSS